MRSLASGVCVLGKIGNLSLGGCLLQLDDTHAFRRGEELELTFCVRQLPVRVQGSVRQVHSGESVGVEFTMMTERGKRRLKDLIEELGEVMRGQIQELTKAKKD